MQEYYGPIDFLGLYQWLAPRVGPVGAGLACLGLTLLETAGWWLPLYVGLAWVLKRRGRLEPADWLPAILLAVAAISMLLAPVARNGDTTEFRHRAGPLLVVILATWSLHLASAAAGVRVAPTLAIRGRIAIVAAGLVSLSVLAVTITAAKRPRMQGSDQFYALKASPDLARVAPLLSAGSAPKPRFAVAHQPNDSSFIDDAARLVALSGVPAYVSCPKFLLTFGGPLGYEGRRRLAVIDRLDHAPNLEALRKLMQEEGITAYVVSSARDAPFDPDRLGALGRSGDYAVYSASPATGGN